MHTFYIYTLAITFVIAFTSLSIIFAEHKFNQVYASDKDSVIEHITVVEKYKDAIAILSENTLKDGDYQYKNKQSFSSITADANKKLSTLKESTN